MHITGVAVRHSTVRLSPIFPFLRALPTGKAALGLRSGSRAPKTHLPVAFGWTKAFGTRAGHRKTGSFAGQTTDADLAPLRVEAEPPGVPAAGPGPRVGPQGLDGGGAPPLPTPRGSVGCLRAGRGPGRRPQEWDAPV